MDSARLICSIALCGLPVAAGTAEFGSDEEAALTRLVRQDCGSCHGLTMKGGLGRAITPEAVGHLDREDLRDIILDGIPGTAMPPWRPLLSEGEALWIADYLLEGAKE